MSLRSFIYGLVGLVIVSVVHARPGDLDSTFGVDGKTIGSLRLHAGGFDSAQSVFAQSDGKILVAETCLDGSRYRTCIARFDSMGNIDPTYGQGGVAYLDIFNMDRLNLISVQLLEDGQGTFVAAACQDREGSCLYRFTTVGTLDVTFGTNGVALSATHRRIVALARQGASILAAGRCMASVTLASALCVWRYQSNGTPDTAFGSQGTLVSSFQISGAGSFQTSIAVVGQSILVGTTCIDVSAVICVLRFDEGGTMNSAFGVAGIARVMAIEGLSYFANLVIQGAAIYVVGACTTNTNFQVSYFCVARLNADGMLDTSFGSGGRISNLVSGTDTSATIGAFMSPSGLVVGGSCRTNNVDHICAARYTETGVIDQSFGVLGYAVGAEPRYPQMAVGATDFSTLFIGLCDPLTIKAVCLARIKPSGAVDAQLGPAGAKSLSISRQHANEGARLMSHASGGRFLTAGNCADPSGTGVPCIARYRPNGDLDNTLATVGYFIAAGGSNSANIEGIADDNGKTIVVTQCATSVTTPGIPCVFRYLENGMLDPTYGVGGFVELVGVTAGTKSLIQGGKMVVAGNCSGATNSICVAKLNANGSPDSTFGVNGRSQFTIPMKNVKVMTVLSHGSSVVLVSTCDNGPQPLVGFIFSTACLTRLQMDGNLDVTYGSGGQANSYPYVFTASIVADLDNNQMVVAGRCGFTGNSCMYRFLQNGELDVTFGNSGQVVIPTTQLRTVTLANGRIFVTYSCSVSAADSICYQAYLSNGQFDRSFGNSGQLQYDIALGTFPVASLLIGDRLVSAATCNKAYLYGDGFVNKVVFSFCHSAIKLSPIAPQPPTLLKATPGAAKAFFDFVPPVDDGGSDVLTYTVSCSPGPQLASGTLSPIMVTGLTNNETHTCTMRATNTAGASVVSNSLTVTPSLDAIELISAGSRKIHGSTHTLTLPINLRPAGNATTTIEPRSGDGVHDIVLLFTQPVTSVASIAAIDGQASSYPTTDLSNAPTERVVRIEGVPDGKRITLRLSGINGTLDVVVPIGFFLADVNGSGKISAADIVSIRRNANSSVNEQNFRFDINRSGAIDTHDLAIVKSRSGQRLIP